MKSDYIIGEKSLMTNYSYNTSIDSQTYNSIKLVRPNKETGKSDVFIRKDSDTIARWGLLQLYQKGGRSGHRRTGQGAGKGQSGVLQSRSAATQIHLAGCQ